MSLQLTQKEVDDLKGDSSQQAGRCDTMQADTYKVCDSLLTITDKMEDLGGPTRWNNLVFDEVAESPGETCTEMEEKVKKISNQHLQHKLEVERAHYTGKPGGGDRLRPIVVKLLRYKDREATLQHIPKERKSLSARTSQTLKSNSDLMPELRAARERGDIACLRYDKLVVHPCTSTPKQP